MAELNEAYEILSDPLKRKKYDEERGRGTQNASSFFDEEPNDVPPEFDPLERDWELAVGYLPHLKGVELKLAKISWRLAHGYRAYLLETKLFNKYEIIADKMECDFLQIYFGANERIIAFAKKLIFSGYKRAAKALNNAVRVIGTNINPEIIIEKINVDYPEINEEQRKEEQQKRVNQDKAFITSLKYTVTKKWLDNVTGNALIKKYKEAQLIDSRSNFNDAEFKTAINTMLEEIKKRGLYHFIITTANKHMKIG